MFPNQKMNGCLLSRTSLRAGFGTTFVLSERNSGCTSHSNGKKLGEKITSRFKLVGFLTRTQ